MSGQNESFTGKTGTVLSIVILIAILSGAGCADRFSGTQNNGTYEVVLPDVMTKPVLVPCSFDRQAGPTEGDIMGLDSCYFAGHAPMEFLDDLRTDPTRPVLVLNTPPNWITLKDVELMMQVIDSSEPAAPVVSPLSSYWPSNETSTVGNEALFLIEGYRTGHYPPGLSSIYYFRPDRAEVRAWWETYGKYGLPDEKAAIRIVQDTNPDLRAYPSEVFPIKSILAEKTPDGWNIAFIVEGSGIPIISARCYHVSNDRQVRLTGNISHSIMILPQDFSAQKCG